MEIIGKNIKLVSVHSDNLDIICRIECDPVLWSYEDEVESDTNAVRDNYLEKIAELEAGQASCYDFLVMRAEDEHHPPIGLAQIWSYVEHRNSWEIGFAILPEYAGRGYGTEAAQLLLSFAFEQLSAHKVVGMCNSYNERSAALMERIGMTREAVFKEELFWQDRFVDQYFYSILEREYFGSSE